MFTGGWSATGTVSSPLTVAFGSWKASSESSFGIGRPPLISRSDSE